VDNCSDTHNSVGAGAGEQLHDWRTHSCTAGYRNRCGVAQDHSGTKACINDLQVLICRSYIY